MFKVNVLRICKFRDIDRPFSFFKSHGFSISAATRISSGRMNGFTLETIEKLCLLLNCTPNDLLEWVPSKDMAANTSHALNSLKRNEALLTTVSQLVNAASVEKLKKIQEIIQRELGEVNS